jgi:hypothetical protein
VFLPSATLARSSTLRRLYGWLAARVAAPHTIRDNTGFAVASHWSLTGALAAGVAIGMYVLCVSGTLWNASLPLTVGWGIFAIFGVVFWFWPFLVSYQMYLLLARMGIARSRLGAALYGACWHMSAHSLLLIVLDSEPLTYALIAPAAVGALWGSWLPAAIGRPPRVLMSA